MDIARQPNQHAASATRRPRETFANRSHSLRVRVASRLSIEEAMTRLRAQAGSKFRFWAETLPNPMSHPASQNFIRRELTRPVTNDVGRGVLVISSDCEMELVLVGRVDNVSIADLRAVAADLYKGDLQKSEIAIDSGCAVAIHSQSVEWGLGDGKPSQARRQIEIPLHAGAVTASAQIVIAATGLLMARYGMEDITLPSLTSFGGRPHQHVAYFADFAPDQPLEAFCSAAAAPRPADFPGSAVPLAFGAVFTECTDSEWYQPCFPSIFQIAVHWTIGPNEVLRGCIDYCPAALHPAVAEQAAGHLVRLIGLLGSNGEGTVPGNQVSVLLPEEEQAIIAAGDRSFVRRTPSSIPGLFHQVVRAHPNEKALSCEGKTLTYEELDRNSNRIASNLIARGIGAGDYVGVCLSRRIDLVVTLLAVLKIGAAYVPMDAMNPEQRLRYTVEDAGLSLVVTDAASFPKAAGATAVTPEELSAETKVEAFDAAATVVDPAETAYVIYTSGSTGRPKGVAIPHDNVAALIHATRTSFALGSSDVWTLFHSPAFDFSVWEIWGCLLTGGHLIIVPYWVSRSPDEFHTLLSEKRVTVLNQTPSAFYALQAADETRPALSGIRLVIFGGESLNTRALLPWFRRYPSSSCQMINMFGITETTVHVTMQRLNPQMAIAGSKCVGPALSGWSVSVRNAAGAVQPIGVPGEIYIGGHGLASHYLNLPELTNERFIQDPITGTRQYRSGDLGCLRPDGALEHLGRIDSQVKIRGFRIELEEIRTIILDSLGVAAAAVIVAEARDGDAASAQISAFVVLTGDMTPDRLRRRIAQYLPDYMMPAWIIPVDGLPLTTNGKLDVKVLKQRSLDTAQLATPPDPISEKKPVGLVQMLSIWRQVIGVEVGPDDDFFEKGGNSLLAVRLLAEIRKIGVEQISVRELYMHSRPLALQSHIEQLLAK